MDRSLFVLLGEDIRPQWLPKPERLAANAYENAPRR